MKKIQSIQWKLIVIYNVIVLIAMIVSGMFILWQLELYEYGKIESELKATTNSFMAVKFDNDSEETIRQTFKEYLEKNTSFYTDKNTEIYILDSNGNYLFSSLINKIDNIETRFAKSAIISAINGISKFEKIYEMTANNVVNEYMSYAYPISIDEEVKIIIYTRIATNSISDTMERSRTIILLSILLAMLITVVTAFFFAKTLTDPIKALTNTAKKMAKGEVYQNLKVNADDEIGQLTKTFNYMSSELNRTLSDISNEKAKLETVFEHMQDGIIAFNMKGEFVHANKMLLNILGTKKKINTIDEINEILNLDIKLDDYKDLKENSIKVTEVIFKKKILNVAVVSYLNDRLVTEGIIVMVQNVTEQRKLDNMRKEFVANVSHELRTPLTTVKGYVETLIDGNVDDEETREKFLKVINNETDRMTFLVQDLLELSRFDNSQIKFDKKEVDIYSLVKDVCIAQRIQVKNKKQNLKVNLPNEEKILIIDTHRISQVITNIISNAIKYSEEGATIKVYSKQKDDKLEIIVEDNGMGIPKEDLERVFERFYRVDKARSRAMGGTGLGLPIAREIMRAHGGDIVIESEYKKGSTVHIVFPVS